MHNCYKICSKGFGKQSRLVEGIMEKVTNTFLEAVTRLPSEDERPGSDLFVGAFLSHVELPAGVVSVAFSKLDGKLISPTAFNHRVLVALQHQLNEIHRKNIQGSRTIEHSSEKPFLGDLNANGFASSIVVPILGGVLWCGVETSTGLTARSILKAEQIAKELEASIVDNQKLIQISNDDK